MTSPAHARAIEAAARNRLLFPRLPDWYLPLAVMIVAIAFGLEAR
jgi:hypothetical protein